MGGTTNKKQKVGPGFRSRTSLKILGLALEWNMEAEIDSIIASVAKEKEENSINGTVQRLLSDPLWNVSRWRHQQGEIL